MLRVLMGHATARAGCAGFSLFQDVTNARGTDDLRPLGHAGGPRRAYPLRRVPPPSRRDRLVGDTSGHQLRRSRAHRWPRHRARAASPAANDSGGGVAMIEWRLPRRPPLEDGPEQPDCARPMGDVSAQRGIITNLVVGPSPTSLATPARGPLDISASLRFSARFRQLSLSLAECRRGSLLALGSSEHRHQPAVCGVLLKTSGVRS